MLTMSGQDAPPGMPASVDLRVGKKAKSTLVVDVRVGMWVRIPIGVFWPDGPRACGPWMSIQASSILIGRQMPRARPKPPDDSPEERAGSPDRDTQIAAFVRGRRKANGMSLRQLAELAGVGLRFLMELEHGKPTLRLDRVNAVLAVLGKRVGPVDLERD